MNPYVIIGIMIAVDLIMLPFIIKKMLKKDGKNKGLKIVALIVAFVAVEAVCSVVYINSNTYFDRLGNRYETIESVRYYDREENQYVITEDPSGREYFTSLNGRFMRIAEITYIDEEGYLYFDIEKKLEKQENVNYIHLDESGKIYYPYDTVKWTSKGEIKLR